MSIPIIPAAAAHFFQSEVLSVSDLPRYIPGRIWKYFWYSPFFILFFFFQFFFRESNNFALAFIAIFTIQYNVIVVTVLVLVPGIWFHGRESSPVFVKYEYLYTTDIFTIVFI